MKRVAIVATVALYTLLLAAVACWQWMLNQPLSSVPWQLPVILDLLALAAGAIALVACRRANLIGLFLLDFSTVLMAAWLFHHLRGEVSLARLLGS
jgi:hypothetical protein